MGLLNIIFGDDNKRHIKALKKIADKIEALEGGISALTDTELKAKTKEFKERLSDGESIYDLMPEAYAVVREAGKRVLGMRHFYVQLMGGIALFQGRIAQMGTGEGKTLVATLPSYLSALKGDGVHIVTVNDYLAKRDSAWMGKIHKFLGLSVGVVVPGMTNEQKRAAYACDITYATNNELGFDYLRDNMVKRKEDKVQRGLDFAIIDEVDSILIDEARTPLIISGAGDKSSDLYARVNQFVKRLEEDEDFEVDEKKKSVTLTEEGAGAAERYFAIDNISDIEHTDLNHHIHQALKAHRFMKRDSDYLVLDGEIVIIDEFTGRQMVGRRYSEGLHQAIEAKEGLRVRNENRTMATITFQNYFKLYKKLSGMTGTAKTEETEFNNIYALDVVIIPPNIPSQRKDNKDLLFINKQAKMKHIMNDIEERHERGQPILVGTVSVESSEEHSKELKKRGIKHIVLNAKNHAQEAEIIAQAGKLGAVTIATNMAGRGTDILLGGNPEYSAKRKMRELGYEEEQVEFADSHEDTDDATLLQAREKYEQLYKQFKEECEEEKNEVIKKGGLYVIGTERHESRRIDNQLRGRAGRQGDVGETLFYLSAEDDMIRLFAGERLKRIVTFMRADEDTAIPTKKMIEIAQKTIEGRNYAYRRYVVEYDNVMNKQRTIIYEERNKALSGEDLHENILKMLPTFVENVIDEHAEYDEHPSEWDMEALNKVVKDKLLYKPYDFFDVESLEKHGIDAKIEELKEVVVQQYKEKFEFYKEQGIDYGEGERIAMLDIIDDKWTEHIDEMESLKRGIQLMVHGQQDPIKAYGREGFDMFEKLTTSIRDTVCHFLIKADVNRTPIQRRSAPQNLKTSGGGANVPERADTGVGRNSPCPCGSGKKYKTCCGNK
ncbi:MAG: preprotein translocase subunit SecA [Firmicutes bacterium]|nr:preprotein translocase subunit SecA [Bacillota bacterium]